MISNRLCPLCTWLILVVHQSRTRFKQLTEQKLAFLGSANSKSISLRAYLGFPPLDLAHRYPCRSHWPSFIDTFAETLRLHSAPLVYCYASIFESSIRLFTIVPAVHAFHRSSTAALHRSSSAHYRSSDYHSLLQNGITSSAVINLRLECLFVAG